MDADDVTTARHGSWSSPITSAQVAAGRLALDQTWLDDGHAHWLEGRGSEGGRVVLVRDGLDLTPEPFNVRSRVHEYGGGAFTVVGEVVVFVNFADQRLHRIDLGSGRGPVAITPDSDGALRYGDLRLDPARRCLFAVREDHRGGGEPVNTIVRLDLDGPNDDGGTVLVEGHDFVAAPRVSPDGDRIAWVTWEHPSMPWDSTVLWVGRLDERGALVSRDVAVGAQDVAVTEPCWAPDGSLLFLGDATGWANPYAVQPGSPPRALCTVASEFGWPQWVLDRSSLGVTDDGTVVCTWWEGGLGHLGTIAADGTRATLDVGGTAYDQVRVEGSSVLCLVNFADRPRAVVRIDLDAPQPQVLQEESAHTLPAALAGNPQPVTWTNSSGQAVHGIFHPPANSGFRAPDGELPPLVVRCHGGPTAMVPASFTLDTTYWTSRGLAVLDVNYGGSTGYGRAYRERLRGTWGLTDVDDCATGALALAEEGRVDRTRLAIRGGSAGGFTTLAALTNTDVFSAGASYFGVADLEGLATDTHKFESRYLDGLVGPYPASRDVYVQRSPVHHLERLSAPMILLQGLEDRVVPPNQARAMAAAVRAKGLPVGLLEFEGEGHGFRVGANIERARDAEAYFYAAVFGYDLPDGDAAAVPPIELENL